jgi:hypothetical protein
MTLSWTPVAGAVTYGMQVLPPGGVWTSLGDQSLPPFGSHSYVYGGVTTRYVPGSTYYFRVRTNGTSSSSDFCGQVACVAVAASSDPTVTTDPATPIGQTTATLNATVNPNGVSTSAYFLWGLTAAYGNSTAAQNYGSGSANVLVSHAITGLSPGTTYHFKAVAYDTSYVDVVGLDRAFNTLPSIPIGPSAATSAATNIATSGASLGAIVNPNGLATTVWFQYGLTASYGSVTASDSLGSGTGSQSYGKPISGLSSNTTYYFRIVAQSTGGTTYGGNMSFPTLPATSPTSARIGVFRPSNNVFYLRSSTGTVSAIVLGNTNDLPIIGDWDGNGTDEIGVFRPSNNVFYLRSSTGTVSAIVLGNTGDKPIIGIWPQP